MTLDTQMTLALLQELLLAIRANDAEGLEAKKVTKDTLMQTEDSMMMNIFLVNGDT